jgi:hypothetical protein
MKSILRNSFILITIGLLMIPIAHGLESNQNHIDLIQDGTSKAVILISPGATRFVKEAADLLSDLIKQSTNVHIPVYRQEVSTPLSAGDKIVIHVGQSKFVDKAVQTIADIDPDGFVITFPTPHHIVISGNTDWGTEFGVYEFLERYLGVRWLLPGPRGIYIPQNPSVVIPMDEMLEEPVFFSRKLSSTDLRDTRGDNPIAVWAHRNRMHERIAFHHNLYRLFPPEKYAETHPEFYPMIDGKRAIPSNDQKGKWQPCFFAPGIVEEAVKTICDYFEKHPTATSYSLAVNDAGGFCQCVKCRAAVTGKKNSLKYDDMSALYYRWTDHVVEGVLEKYPNKWFGCLAYREVATPPEDFRMHSRIIPFITYDRMYWVNSNLAQQRRRIQQQWVEHAESLGWYDYIYGTPYLLPRVYFHTMAETYRYAQENNVKAIYAEAYPNWGEGPKMYLALKLMWNPNIDVDAVLNDWYTCAVGEAAAPDLKAYYDLWEDFWTRRISDSKWIKIHPTYGAFHYPDYLDLVTYEDLQISRKLLTSTISKTTTPLQRERAEMLLKAFEFYEASAISYLGLVQKSYQEGMDIDYYLMMDKKRYDLVEAFQHNILLKHPSRFDQGKYKSRLRWFQWVKKPEDLKILTPEEKP